MNAKPAFPATYRFSTGFKVFTLGSIPFFGLMTFVAIDAELRRRAGATQYSAPGG